MTGTRTKLVFAAPTDTDPPSNPIWTTDQMVAVQGPSGQVKDLPCPKDAIFGAVGNGLADDTVAIQAWLDAIAGGAGYLCPGTYLVQGLLRYSGNTTVYGAGKGAATLLLSEDADPSTFLIANKNFVFGASEIKVDGNVNFYDMCFEGSATATAQQDFVDAIGVNGITFRNCLFQHRRGSLTAFNNCNNVVIDNCEFTDWGLLDFDGFNTQTYAGGSAIFCLNSLFNTSFTNNYVHGGAGGFFLPQPNTGSSFCTCTGNRFEGVLEFGIAGVCSGSLLNDNTIFGVVQIDVSGHGMELQGQNFTVSDNVILAVDQCGLAVSSTSGVNIIGNQITNYNNAVNPETHVHNPTSGGIILLTNTGVGTGQPPEFTTISGNTITAANGFGANGIVFSNLTNDPTKLMRYITCVDNNLGLQSWYTGTVVNPLGKYINYYIHGPLPSNGYNVMGDNWIHRNNYRSQDAETGPRATDSDPVTINFLIASGTTINSQVRVGGVGFRPSRIEFDAILPSIVKASRSNGYVGWTAGWNTTQFSITAQVYVPFGPPYSFTVNGDASAFNTAGSFLDVYGSIGNDGLYTIVDAIYSGGPNHTVITVTEPVLDSNVGGFCGNITTGPVNMQNSCFAWAADGSAAYSAGFPGSACIAVMEPDPMGDPDGIPICQARIDSLDHITDDGCILTINATTTADVYVDATFYP